MVAVNRPLPLKDVGVLGKEAEDQPRHEVVHVVAALCRAPIGVVLQQLDIEPVQAAGGPDVEGAFADLLDGGDASQRQEEAEMVGKVGIGAGDRLAGGQVLGLEGLAIGREDELGLGRGGLRARLECGQRPRSSRLPAGGDMDVVALEDAAENVGLVRGRPTAAA